jgi:hypothetical protein
VVVGTKVGEGEAEGALRTTAAVDNNGDIMDYGNFRHLLLLSPFILVL